MEAILRDILTLDEFGQFADAVQNDQSLYPIPVPRSFRLPLLAALAPSLNRPLVIVSDRLDHATRLFDEMSVWLPDGNCLLFSEPTPLFYEDSAWELSVRRERMQVLTLLSSYNIPFAKKPTKPPIIFTTTRALMTRTIPRRDFIRNCKKIALNTTHKPDELFANLYGMG